MKAARAKECGVLKENLVISLFLTLSMVLIPAAIFVTAMYINYSQSEPESELNRQNLELQEQCRIEAGDSEDTLLGSVDMDFRINCLAKALRECRQTQE